MNIESYIVDLLFIGGLNNLTSWKYKYIYKGISLKWRITIVWRQTMIWVPAAARGKFDWSKQYSLREADGGAKRPSRLSMMTSIKRLNESLAALGPRISTIQTQSQVMKGLKFLSKFQSLYLNAQPALSQRRTCRRLIATTINSCLISRY